MRILIDMNLTPAWCGVLSEHEMLLQAGALIVVEEWRSRVRILPLGR